MNSVDDSSEPSEVWLTRYTAIHYAAWLNNLRINRPNDFWLCRCKYNNLPSEPSTVFQKWHAPVHEAGMALQYSQPSSPLARIFRARIGIVAWIHAGLSWKGVAVASHAFTVTAQSMDAAFSSISSIRQFSVHVVTERVVLSCHSLAPHRYWEPSSPGSYRALWR